MNTETKSVGFDLSSLKQQEQATYRVPVVFNDDGDPVSGFIIVGKNSTQYQQIAQKLRAVNIQQASKRKSDIDATTEEGSIQIVSKVVNNEHTIAVGVTVGWYGFLENGEEKAFDEDYVSMIFKAMPDWQAKVLSGLEKDSNFMTI